MTDTDIAKAFIKNQLEKLNTSWITANDKVIELESELLIAQAEREGINHLIGVLKKELERLEGLE